MERIFIHLDRRSPPGKFDRYGSRLVAIYNYFQAALTLFADHRIEAAAVVRVAVEMVDRHLHHRRALRNSLKTFAPSPHAIETVNDPGRAIADGAGETDLLPALGTLPGTRDLLRTLASGLRDLGPLTEAELVPKPSDAPIDYLAALADLPQAQQAEIGIFFASYCALPSSRTLVKTLAEHLAAEPFELVCRRDFSVFPIPASCSRWKKPALRPPSSAVHRQVRSSLDCGALDFRRPCCATRCLDLSDRRFGMSIRCGDCRLSAPRSASRHRTATGNSADFATNRAVPDFCADKRLTPSCAVYCRKFPMSRL